MNNEEMKKAITKAVKHAVLSNHNWSYFKDATNMIERIESEWIDPENEKDFLDAADPLLSKVAAGHDGKIRYDDMLSVAGITNKKLELKNNSITSAYELAFAYQNGFHILLDEKISEVFGGHAIKDSKKLILSNLINDDDEHDTQMDYIFNEILESTNINDMLVFIIDNLKLIDFDFKFFLYGVDTDKKLDNDYITTIYSINIVGDTIRVSNGKFMKSDPHSVYYSNSSIKCDRDNNTKGTIRCGFENTEWKYMSGEKLIKHMYITMYGIMMCLSSIIEFMGRVDIDCEPDILYEYKVDHIPSCILHDNHIHYNKYDEHINTNPFYPKNRKSPRCHYRKPTWRFNPKTGKKDIFVRGTIVGDEKEKMKYKQNIE